MEATPPPPPHPPPSTATLQWDGDPPTVTPSQNHTPIPLVTNLERSLLQIPKLPGSTRVPLRHQGWGSDPIGLVPV